MRNVEKRIEELFFLVKIALFFFVAMTLLVCLFFVSSFQLSQDQAFSGLGVLANIAQIVIAGGVVVAYFQYKKSVEQHRVDNLYKERNFVSKLLKDYQGYIDSFYIKLCRNADVVSKKYESSKGVYALLVVSEIVSDFYSGAPLKKFEIKEERFEKIFETFICVENLLSLENLSAESKRRIKDQLKFFMSIVQTILDAAEKKNISKDDQETSHTLLTLGHLFSGERASELNKNFSVLTTGV